MYILMWKELQRIVFNLFYFLNKLNGKKAAQGNKFINK